MNGQVTRYEFDWTIRESQSGPTVATGTGALSVELHVHEGTTQGRVALSRLVRELCMREVGDVLHTGDLNVVVELKERG